MYLTSVSLLIDIVMKIPPFLEYLQANIVEPNGRKYNRCIFLHLTCADARKNRDFITSVFLDSNLHITTAKSCLEADDRNYRKVRKREYLRERRDKYYLSSVQEPFPIKCFHLTYGGLQKLAIPTIKEDFKPFAIFRQGMYVGLRGDEHWDSAYTDSSIDALFFIASDDYSTIRRLTSELKTKLDDFSSVAEIVQIEDGMQRLDEQGFTIEAFGFRDGLSNPVLWEQGVLKQDYLKGSFLHEEDTEKNTYGSFFVFQKYAQNVAIFNKKITQLAEKLGVGEEYAAAQVIGRFRDGTPLSVANTPIASRFEFSDEIGDFNDDKSNYDDDKYGLKCPFHSHIRKMNPRTKKLVDGSELYSLSMKTGSKKDFFIHILRRAITYDQREIGKGQGLLFMSYQRSIFLQFLTLLDWSMDNRIPGYDYTTGDDPLLAKSSTDTQHRWNTAWGNNPTNRQVSFSFGDVVQLKGGAYFYTPSTYFLEQLRTASTKHVVLESVD